MSSSVCVKKEILRDLNSNNGNGTSEMSLHVIMSENDGDGVKASGRLESSSASTSDKNSSEITLQGKNKDTATPTPTPTPAVKPQKKTPNDFVFGKLLGEGSFSSVYLAKDIRGHREYAIKVCDKKHILRENKAESIQREREVMTVLSNNPSPVAPYFVHLFATFQDSERLYFVMTYGSRGELLKLLNTQEIFSLETCKFYAGEILQALSHLHNLKIVHRDLKPENILLNAEGHILITDFGSAKVLPKEVVLVPPVETKLESDISNDEAETETGHSVGNQRRTRKNSFVGTAQYVSPEVLQGKYSEVGPPADLWAFGCVLFQFLTGSSPFNGPNEFLIFQKIVKLNYEFPSGFDATAKNLVENLLKLEPQERLGSNDTVRYSSIQSHEFFQGINFDELFNQQAPCVSSSECKTVPLKSSQAPSIPAHFEPGFNPRIIAERILRSDGDLPWGDTVVIEEAHDEQVTLIVSNAPITPEPEPSIKDVLVPEKSDPAKIPSNPCYCC